MKSLEKKIIGITSKVFGMTDLCPVIYYHDIVKDGDGDTYQKTDISLFESQIAYIAKSGLRSLTFDDLKKEPNALYEKGNVLICFDDGYVSNYLYAYPICKKYHVKFNIFIAGNAVFSHHAGYMNQQQMTELYRSGIVGIGAHTWNHIDCLTLSGENYPEEVEHENTALCNALGIDRITDFCFPFGRYNDTVIDLLASKNVYARIYTSDGKKPVMKANTLVLGRVAIENNDSDADFINKVSGYFGSYRIFKKLKNLIHKEAVK